MLSFFMFTDSHCHLSFPELRHDIAGVLQAMSSAGVDRALTICTTLEEFEDVHALAAGHAQLWATVGVHPDNEGVREPSVDELFGAGPPATGGRDWGNRSGLLPP